MSLNFTTLSLRSSKFLFSKAAEAASYIIEVLVLGLTSLRLRHLVLLIEVGHSVHLVDELVQLHIHQTIYCFGSMVLLMNILVAFNQKLS